jgi:hypothetical protein
MGESRGKTLVESAFAIFDTLRRGAPNVFPRLSPVPAGGRKLGGLVWVKEGKLGGKSLFVFALWNGLKFQKFPLIS